MPPTPSYGADFHLPPTHYLLNHSVGCALKSAPEAVAQHFFTPWSDTPAQAWPAWLARIEAFRQGLATLLNGKAEAFCPQVNLSSSLAKVLGALNPSAGRNEIVLSKLDFPSLGFVAQQATRMGFRLRWVEATQNHQDVATWAALMSGKTQCVLIAHAQSTTGAQLPVMEIAALARHHGALSIVDVAQSIGVLPIDLPQWQADVVIGSCVKWLCAGSGAGFLWLHPEALARLQPVDVGWFSHQTPFEFDIEHFDYHATALRFWGGTPSILPFVLAAHSLAYFNPIGSQTIRAHNLALTQVLLDAVPPQYLVSPREPAHRNGTVVLHLQGQHARWCERMTQMGIAFDERHLGVRLSPHLYTARAAMDAVLESIEAVTP